MEIAVGHHVYSSMGGYKTLYATPGAPAEAIAAAEDLARRLYRVVGSRPQRAFSRVTDGLFGALRGFAMGTDHAGRPRTCVHTVFFAEEDLARIPWFNPFSIPDDLFLPADLEDLQYLRFNLKETWVVGDTEDAGAAWARWGRGIPEVALRMLVPTMLDPKAVAIVLNRRDTSFDMARALAYTLPPLLRRRLGYLDHAVLYPTPFHLNFFANDPDASVLAGDEVLLDLNRCESRNDPLRNPYADFVIAALAPGGNPAPLWCIVGALEKFDAAFVFSNNLHCTNVLSAFRRFAPLFKPDGALTAAAAPLEAGDAVLEFMGLGLKGLAYALLRDLSAVVEAKVPDQAAKLRRRTDAVCLRLQTSGPGEVKELVAVFRAALGGKAASRGEEDTFISPPTLAPGTAGDGIEKSLGFED
jgi:hypothetical protein